MDSIDQESLVLSRREYDALIHVRGLEPSAHLMVMCAIADYDKGTWTLQGPLSAFVALQNDLFDEIDAKLSPPAKLRQLTKIYNSLFPDNDL